MTEVESINIVAWWGAIVATMVLLWDVVKWLTSGAKVKYRYALNIHYDDGRVIGEEKTDNGSITTYAEYCHIELVNNGTSPTTIMNIWPTHKHKKGIKLSQDKSGLSYYYASIIIYLVLCTSKHRLHDDLILFFISHFHHVPITYIIVSTLAGSESHACCSCCK